MPLPAGTRLGPCEVFTPIGADGTAAPVLRVTFNWPAALQKGNR